MAQRPERPAAGRPASPPRRGGIPLEAFFEDARNLALDAFEARHGSGFLLATAAGAQASRESTTTRLLLDGIDADPGARTADLAVVVHPLRPANPASGDMVTLGREPQHDVVILDPSVSRFHAFARRAEGGQFQIQDAGSTNGTTVNGRSVLQRGAGPPTPLKPGDTLRLGQAEFTFTDAGALRSFVTKAAGG